MISANPPTIIRVMYRIVFMLSLAIVSAAAIATPATCSYSTYKWNVEQRRAVAHQRVSKPRATIDATELDAATGCTVCEEDQVELTLPGLRSFRVCKHVADKLRLTLNSLQQQNAPLLDIVGYRVGMTRGAVDKDGNRTGFSNHSFGVAVDINTEQNGLYDNCYQFGPHCRLIKGGPWDSNNAASLSADSIIVTAFKRQGFRWGGEIAGKQKDFMHFSPSGY